MPVRKSKSETPVLKSTKEAGVFVSKTLTPTCLYSQNLFQLIHMSKLPSWGFSAETSVGLPGAHGSELVRSFSFFDQEQVVFTAGEDGKIIAWRPN